LARERVLRIGIISIMKFRNSILFKVGSVILTVQVVLCFLGWLTDDQEFILVAVFPGMYVSLLLPQINAFLSLIVAIGANWFLIMSFVVAVRREQNRRRNENA
jgi:hypothetical protein